MKDANVKTLSRRDFVRIAGQVGITAAALKVLLELGSRVGTAHAGHGKVNSQYHWVMVIDLELCTGCNYCTYACKAANDTAEGITWNAVFNDNHTFSQEVYIPRPCMHCENAPCVSVCPVGATYHREDGLVEMDYTRCIGCRYCQVACPFGARYFNWEVNDDPNPMVPTWGLPEVERRPRGVVEKCTFCAQRLDAGLAQGKMPGVDPEATPACVNICPVGARVFGDLNDPDSRVSVLLRTRESIRLREETGVNPRVYYLLPVPEQVRIAS
jgi:Fe-S-cluster-containing dehydrogenase component